jgi:tRNA (mo5U34)-methyltransferase
VTLREEVEALPWFHEMDLGEGVVTPGIVERNVLAQQADVYFQDGVEGMSVLDVGCWDGFNSFEAKRRGAARVLATDHYVWHDERGIGSRKKIELARDRLDLDVEILDIDLAEIGPESVGRFDLVLFCGVLYHLRDPLGGLAHVARVCDHTLVVETIVDARDIEKPAMVFYPGSEFADDPTNWWGPNVPCVTAMLRDVGFTDVRHTPHPLYKQRAIFHAQRSSRPLA